MLAESSMDHLLRLRPAACLATKIGLDPDIRLRAP